MLVQFGGYVPKVTPKRYLEVTALLKLSTTGLVDDDSISLQGRVLVVTGTYRYENALAAKTVLKIEELDTRPVRQAIAE